MRTKTLLLILIYLLSYTSQGKESKNKINDGYFDQINQLMFKNLFINKNKTMLNDVNKNICLLYLRKYEEKDLKSIEEMFSNDIVLRDWKIRVVGKENALIETRKNFESAKSIQIEVLSIYENANTVAAELKIIVDNKEELYVVDVVTINFDGKISSIKAYIGRGDN